MSGSHKTIERAACQSPSGLQPLVASDELPHAAADPGSVPWPRRERWLIAVAILSQLAGTTFMFGWRFGHHGASPIPVPALGADSVSLTPPMGWMDISLFAWLGAAAGVPVLSLVGLLCIWGRQWTLRLALLCALAACALSASKMYTSIRSCQHRRAEIRAAQASQAQLLPRARAALAAVLQRQQQASAAYRAAAERATASGLPTGAGMLLLSRGEQSYYRRLLLGARSTCRKAYGQTHDFWKNLDEAIAQVRAEDVAEAAEREHWPSQSYAERRKSTRLMAAELALRCTIHEKHLAALNVVASSGAQGERDNAARHVRRLMAQAAELAERLKKGGYEPEPADPEEAADPAE